MYDQLILCQKEMRDVEVAFGNGDSVQVSSQSFFFHSTHHLAGLVVWMTLEGPFLFKSVSGLLCTMLDGGAFCRRVVHLADVEPPEKSQRPVLDIFGPGDLHWFGQKMGKPTAQSESFSFEKACSKQHLSASTA